MKFIDTHCHLCDPKFTDLDKVIDNMREQNVKKVINMACCIKTALECKETSKKYPEVYYATGIHPMDIKDMQEGDLDRLKDIADDEKCVAIGEIGLDYYWDKSYKDKQIQGLLYQLELAKELKLPFSFHSREATLDTVTILKENKDKLVHGGVLHCFAGSKETAKEILKLGLKIGFGGTLTFKNARSVLEVCDYVPLDSIVTETDCPFLAPEPVRGTVNEPKNIPYIVDKIATIKGIEKEKMADIIYQNAIETFNKLK